MTDLAMTDPEMGPAILDLLRPITLGDGLFQRRSLGILDVIDIHSMLLPSEDSHLSNVSKDRISFLLTMARQEIERHPYTRLTHGYWAVLAAEVNRLWDVRVDPLILARFLMLLLAARRDYLLMGLEPDPMELLVSDLDIYLWEMARREKRGHLNIVPPNAFFDFKIPDKMAAKSHDRARELSWEMRGCALQAPIPNSDRLRVYIEVGAMSDVETSQANGALRTLYTELATPVRKFFDPTE